MAARRCPPVGGAHLLSVTPADLLAWAETAASDERAPETTIRAGISRAYYAAYCGLRDALRPQLPASVNFGAHERVIHVVRRLVVPALDGRVADVVEQHAIDLDAARQARVDADYRLQDAELRAPLRRAALLKQLVLVRPLVRDAPVVARAILAAPVPAQAWVSYSSR